MDYKEALKEVQSKKQKDNFMVVTISYKTLVLPYKDGLALVAALANTEELEDQYSVSSKIIPVNRDTFLFRTLSAEEYERIKVCALLGITQDALKEQLKQ